MSTFMANKANIERKWYVVDAAGKPLGKTAVIVADLLRGKGKAHLHPPCRLRRQRHRHQRRQGRPDRQQDGARSIYRTHSGWVGGLKETQYRILMQDKPELAMRVAVRGMMPRNTVTKDSLKRLHIYAGEQHDHAGSEARAGSK